MKSNKTIKIILAVIAVIIIVAVVAVACVMRVADPNKMLKKYAVEVTAGEEYPAKFKSLLETKDMVMYMASFKFTPEESAEYTFTASGEAVSNEVGMSMFVLDEDLSELFDTANYEDGDVAPASDSMEGTTFLTKGQLYYVAIDVFSDNAAGMDAFKESFRFSVSKAGDGEPEEIKTGESITLKLNKDQQACAMFKPEETAFYDFDTSIVSKDAGVGFSSVYDITGEDKTSMIVTDGVCFMEAGKTYYVWVGVDETSVNSSEVELGCRKMASESASGLCSIEVNGETVIEYTAEANMPLMMISSSDGDPDVVMYDSEGFMLRKDDDSGETVSENPHEFALGFNAEKGKVYRICINGEFTQCTVTVQEYKGDGTEPDSGAKAENAEDTEKAESETGE
ncbi:MAG: hypothetical protein IJH92_01380 [Mogibacterium sp.]|nr:hypothetical protein [Mogibacterium sp.]